MFLLLAALVSTTPILDDYPPEALRHHWEGTVSFTLDISASGQVENCTITQSSGHDSLDNATCDKLVKRARFSPAVGSDGKPVPSTYSGHMVWKIGG